MNEVSIVIVDDDADVRHRLRTIVERAGATVLGEAANGLEGLEVTRRVRPACVLMDVSMPVMGGFAAARKLRQEFPEIRIVFISQYTHGAYVDEALRLGAAGYVIKGAAATDLPLMLEAVRNGGQFLSRVPC
jgi:DNA-binding NarL/FixJ family response regulator